MLVLSRKQTESIVIGDNITVKVMRISGGRVRLAIDAPEHIRISRGELVATSLAPAGPEPPCGEVPRSDFQQAP